MKGQWARIILGVWCAAVGLVAVTVTLMTFKLNRGVEENGARVTAHITQRETLSFDQTPQYRISYWFLLPDGRRLEGRHTEEHDFLPGLKEGDTFVLLYDARNPRRNFPQGYSSASVPKTIWGTVVGVMFLLFGALFFTQRPQREVQR